MNRSRTSDAPRHYPLRTRRAHLAGLGGAAALAVAYDRQGVAAAADGLGADPAAINDWNATAVAALADAARPNPEAYMWLAFAHAAMYNADAGITGRYALYKWAERGPATASPEAAAAAAANRVLLTCFGSVPAARARVADAYAAALGRVPGGAAKEQGVVYGERTADRILALREGDGRFAALPFTLAPAPGVWRPTPPANAPFLAPWLSRLRPWTLTADGGITNWALYAAQLVMPPSAVNVHGRSRESQGARNGALAGGVGRQTPGAGATAKGSAAKRPSPSRRARIRSAARSP